VPRYTSCWVDLTGPCPQRNPPQLRDALARAGNSHAIVRIFPTGNHGLLEARTGFNSEARLLTHYVSGFQEGLVRGMIDVPRR
jgi:hypothetical protein